MSVSYTHLDVYKRQVQNIAFLSANRLKERVGQAEGFSCFQLNDSGSIFYAVYNHSHIFPSNSQNIWCMQHSQDSALLGDQAQRYLRGSTGSFFYDNFFHWR